jgi:hypothetical protein
VTAELDLAPIEARLAELDRDPERDTLQQLARLAQDVPALLAEVRRLRPAMTAAEVDLGPAADDIRTRFADPKHIEPAPRAEQRAAADPVHLTGEETAGGPSQAAIDAAGTEPVDDRPSADEEMFVGDGTELADRLAPGGAL